MYLGHGTGVDDIAIMVTVILGGLWLLRRSEQSVRARATESERETHSSDEAAPVVADPPEETR